jgi:hypothetical protein
MGRRPGTVAVLVPVVFSAALLVPFAGFVPDDLYIYLQFARSFAERGEIAFNPGEPVNAVTSSLWFLLLAAAHALHVDPLRTAQVASLVCALLAVAGVSTLTLRATGRAGLALGAGLIFASDPWVLRWGLSGMEGAASAAAVAWCFALRAREPAGRGAIVGSAVLLALTPLLRPECGLLVAIVLAWDLVDALRTGRRSRLVAGVVALALPAAWALYAWNVFGTVMPSTVAAKGSLGSVFLGAWSALFRVGQVLAVGQGVPLALLGVGALVWGRHRFRPGPAGLGRVWGPVLLWGVGLVALYAVRNVSVYTRYLMILSPLVAAAGLVVAGRLLQGRVWQDRALRLAVGVAVAANLALTASVVLPATRAYAEHMESVNVTLGRMLAETTPADAVVAIPNIGAVGYLSERRILDLNGLVTPDLVPYKIEGRIAEYLREHPPDYFVDIHDQPDNAERNPPGLRLTPIWKAPFRYMFVSRPEPLWYALYAVEGVLEE